MKSKTASTNKNTVIDIIRGTLIAVIASLIMVLILALIVKLTGLSDAVILPLNQVIKIMSVLIGCFIGVKEKARGALKGGAIGLLFTVISIFVFLILKNNLSANSFSFIDFVSGIVGGLISGVIAVNFKR